jgi:dihydrolipoamide dehydrogenase
MENFDVIIIGSGSGLDVAASLAQQGKRVAIIERSKMGGTCLNRGCIPSKLLIHSADIVDTIRNAHLFGINVEKFSIDYTKIISRVNSFVMENSEKIRREIAKLDSPKLFSSECSFVGVKTLELKDSKQQLTAKKILISAGSRPAVPPIKGLCDSGYMTSNEALSLEVQPKILTILGGGYIACELAHFFDAMGTEINIVTNKERLLNKEDTDISNKITEIFARKYNLFLNCNTTSVHRNKDEINLVTTNSSGENINIQSGHLLVAVGRIPNSDSLNLSPTNVKTTDEGYILTNEYLETNVKGIFALGDIVGRFKFKHSANLEANYAYHNIMNPDQMVPVDYEAMPHAIFSSPQVAGVGYTEQELKLRNIEYIKSSHKYINTAMGKAIEDEDGFVKFLVGKRDKTILGCHILGTDASVLIHEVIPVMKTESPTIHPIVRAVHVHPALSEVIARSAHNAL